MGIPVRNNYVCETLLFQHCKQWLLICKQSIHWYITGLIDQMKYVEITTIEKPQIVFLAI